MRRTLLAGAALFIFLFSGCSTKEVFEPKDIAGEWEYIKTIEAPIKDKSADVALLANNHVLYGDKAVQIPLAPHFRIVGRSGGYILTTDIDGHLRLYDIQTKNISEFSLEKTIAAASTDGEVVAVVFASGDLALYSLRSKALMLKLEGASSVAVDARIVNPYFMNDLVLFLTLDGKVVIVNKKLKKRLRTIIVSAAEYFNNVIYFDILGDKLIVATATKILSFGAKQQRAQYEARSITHDKKFLYVATKQGDIVKLTPTLDQTAKVHFPFAHFLGLSVQQNALYALEKEGYLIKLGKDLLTYNIYSVDLSDESYVYPSGNGFIVDDMAIMLKSDAAHAK